MYFGRNECLIIGEMHQVNKIIIVIERDFLIDPPPTMTDVWKDKAKFSLNASNYLKYNDFFS